MYDSPSGVLFSIESIKGNTKTFVVENMADEHDVFRSLTDEDKELFDSVCEFKRLVNITVYF